MMTMTAPLLLAAAVGAFALIASACAEQSDNTNMSASQPVSVTRQEWDAARAHTVFFGHQSIGENILDGLGKLAAKEGWPAFPVVEANGTAHSASPALLHAKVGANGDPSSKVVGFKDAMNSGAAAGADIALMKFCFWDIRRDTNVDKVFDEYRATLDELSRKYPDVTFLHATVPLVVKDTDVRAGIRRMLGMGVPTDADNATREALNQKIRAEYGRSGRVFDIAALEGPAAESIPFLAKELSSDGAHLNDAGRARVAAGLVKSLSAAASQRESERGTR